MTQKLSGPGCPRGKFDWQSEHRLVLAWLNEKFSLSMKERAAVFNAVFDECLRRCGKPEGQTGASLSSQYSERKEKPAWRDVYEPPRSLAHRQRRLDLEKRVIETIVKVTKKQPVGLVPRKPASKRKASTLRPGTPSVPTPLVITQIRAAAYESPSRIPAKRPRSSTQDLDDEDYSPVSRPAHRPRLAPQHRSPRLLASAHATLSSAPTTQSSVVSESILAGNGERRLLGVFLPSTSTGGGSASPGSQHRFPTTPRSSSETSHRRSSAGSSSRRSYSRRRDLPKFAVIREHGPVLNLTAEELEVFNGPAIPITSEDAFPPSPPLLFRYDLLSLAMLN